MSLITSKAQSISLVNSGAFGNTVRVWPSVAAMRASGFKGDVVIRSYHSGFATRYNVKQADLDGILDDLAAKGYPLGSLYLNEACPDEHLLLQGEVVGRHLTYSSLKLPTKMALQRECRYADGSATEAILRWAMNDGSYDDFQVLREQHPGAVIEFGCYGVCLGSVPHRNVLIWEVRDTY